MDTVLPLTSPSRALTAAIAHVSAIDVDDGTLIERVAAHERVAFEELYRRFARTVLGLALRRIGDRSRSEDTVQEVFAAVWRSAASYDRGRGLGEPRSTRSPATRPSMPSDGATHPRSRILPRRSRRPRSQTRKRTRHGTPGVSIACSRP